MPLVRPVLAALALAASVSACAPSLYPSGPGPAPSSAFRAEDFGWSARSGQASIEGRIVSGRANQPYVCTGSVGLTPVTPYTMARFNTLYGSTQSAALPEAVIRARTVADPNADYRSFVRSVPCSDGRFSFTGLPDGGWFVIVPASVGGERMVLMRRVETRGGRMVSVSL